MKRRHCGYIVATLLLAMCSQGVHYVSVVTESWVVANEWCGNVSLINVGLFQASLVQEWKNSTLELSNLALTCFFNLNVCEWTCKTREFYGIQDIAISHPGQLSSSCDPSTGLQNCSIHERGCEGNKSILQIKMAFMNRMVWFITAASVSVNGLVGLACVGLTMYNVNHIPSNYFLSIRGLYFWYTLSITLTVVTLLVWGFEFLLKFCKSIGTQDTITGLLNISGRAHLGYSYWCQLGIVIFQILCVALLWHRENLFDCRFVNSLDRRWNTLSTSNL